ncbi:unnamed protein product, partial [Phaeothamnion confervicola]
MTYFPMFIATLSLLTSVYNGYLNNRFVDIIENNVARVEYMRTCKEIIEAFFIVKTRTAALAERASLDRRTPSGGSVAPAERFAAVEATARVGALGTYLANLRDEAVRERYTQLTWALEKAVAAASTTEPASVAKLFEGADLLFGGLNADCVKS